MLSREVLVHVRGKAPEGSGELWLLGPLCPPFCCCKVMIVSFVYSFMIFGEQDAVGEEHLWGAPGRAMRVERRRHLLYISFWR